jgi:WD40 repeat protein
MKRHFLFVLAFVLVSLIPLTVFAQDAEATPEPITPPDDGTTQIELSPDGLYVAVMAFSGQGNTELYMWRTADTTHPIRLDSDLPALDRFIWSPNSQYLAVLGHRGKEGGTEYAVLIYDVLDTGDEPDTLSALPGRDFREFVGSNDIATYPHYFPAWSTDGHIIAINFRDGIHFYDITACDNGECKPLHTLDIGAVSWFDWQGNTLITLEGKKIQLWDVSAVFQ